MKIRQYRPAYFEGFETKEAEFETLEELEAIPFVRAHTGQADHHRLSLTRSHWGVCSLMAEFDGGRKWLVVGFITGGRPDLPPAVFEKEERFS